MCRCHTSAKTGMESYCADRFCRQTGRRHVHPPYEPKPSLEQRIAELERQFGIAAAEIVKLWNEIERLK